MRFQDITGLGEVKQKLIDAVNANHVAHAQLFAGGEGSANLAMALAFAAYLNCQNPGPNDACGVCPSCEKNSKFVHPDVNFIFPTAATPKFKREDATSDKFLKEWRAFLLQTPYGNVTDWAAHFGWENKLLMIPTHESKNIIRALSLKAFEGKYKVMIIWLPEVMHANAANGILKILEEPPAQTIFLMVSNDPNKLLTTITSRTQKLLIRPFNDSEIIESLENEFSLEAEKAQKLAYFSEGNLREAKRLATGNESDTQEVFKDWFRQCFTYNFENLIALGDAFQKKGKEFQLALLATASKVMRESMIHLVQVPQMARIPEGEEDFIGKFSKVFTEEKIMKIAPKFDEAQYHIERNANPKILFLDLSLTIAQIARS
ncbi:DNA polymerase III subunit [Roseivirga pacifica]